MLSVFCLQYSVGTPEMSYAFSDHSGGSTLTSSTASDQAGYYKQSAFMGSCKHQVWQAIRASSAAPYYLDDFSVGTSLPFSFLVLSLRLKVSFTLIFFIIFVCFSNRLRFIPLARWCNSGKQSYYICH